MRRRPAEGGRERRCGWRRWPSGPQGERGPPRVCRRVTAATGGRGMSGMCAPGLRRGDRGRGGRRWARGGAGWWAAAWGVGWGGRWAMGGCLGRGRPQALGAGDGGDRRWTGWTQQGAPGVGRRAATRAMDVRRSRVSPGPLGVGRAVGDG
ncbi:hypothetical protein MRB53_042221 [Persea americana]|nr:hypothetical protein MRB53_042209 [Persea americana]KAJ8603254.1 hypothetical protein MRB53_042215 [Persea americana]KAJ8603260.1 hypothetical protein MRB53_042221 [Persea americana]